MHSAPFSSGENRGGTVLTFSRAVIFPVISEYGMNWESILGGEITVGAIRRSPIHPTVQSTREFCMYSVQCSLTSGKPTILLLRKVLGRQILISQ